MVDTALVSASTSAGVATIRLNRAAKRNALSSALLTELLDVLRETAECFPAVRAVVIVGEGPTFSAGADITEFEDWDAGSLARFLELGSAVFSFIAAMPQPVIAGVHGQALGGGLELALACDIRIADTTARFGLPEITIGGVPGWGGTVRLQEVVGRGLAAHMTLTGESIDAATAASAGLVHDVVPDGELERGCSALAGTLALRSPTALRLAKRALATGSPYDVRGQADGEQYANLACMLSQERRTSVASFTARSAGQ